MKDLYNVFPKNAFLQRIVLLFISLAFLTVFPQLAISKVPTLSDKNIRLNLIEQFSEDPAVNSNWIDIKIGEGVVELTGHVSNIMEKDRAEELVSRNEGVNEIVNRLIVGTEWLAKSDKALKDDIRDEMWWSPFVDEADVDVAVEEGVATLSGTVDSWNERWKAEENAFEGGAKDVVNLIDVKEKSGEISQSGT